MPRKPPIIGISGRAKSWDHGKRESRHTRGYGWAWEKLRKRILERDKYLCQPCYHATPQRITPAAAVDHIEPKAKGGTDKPANLRAICDPCHRAKSLDDQGKRPRRIRRTFGADGWPIEG
jgi:5-methylcytosine-specific restriction endonuclease McrA